VFAECDTRHGELGKQYIGSSAKITTVSYRRLLTAVCRASSFAECLALDKEIFAECIPVSRVLLSANAIVTESRTYRVSDKKHW
jgi:hypothetical protein